MMALVTLKHSVANASLQMVSGEAITSSNEMFKGVLQRNIKHFLIRPYRKNEEFLI